MIFIVDSGATKADWTALNEKGMKEFGTQTLGLNPEVLTEEIAMERLTTNEQLNENRKRARHVYFYGAGCGTERLRVFLHAILQRFFSNATIVVKEDTYAAVHATTANGERAIVGILGTGANCSYWDGKKLHQAVDSLGYSLMDECSGNFLSLTYTNCLTLTVTWLLLHAFWWKIRMMPIAITLSEKGYNSSLTTG